MKARFLCSMAALITTFALAAGAQAPAGAPAGTTGVCNDGSFSSAPVKRGACNGHKGVKTWFVATSASPAPASAMSPTKSASVTPPAAPSAPVPTPAPRPQVATPAAAPSAARTQAPGGGNGQVWVNTASNVYHCPGDRSYGTTKAGQYMSEADAKAKGARPAAGKVCKP